MKKYLIFIVVLCMLPAVCNATVITYDDVKISFEIDETEWKRSDFTTSPKLLDRKWENDCGMITTASVDIYSTLSEEEIDGIDREYYNYKNVFDDDLIDLIIDEILKNNFGQLDFSDVEWEYYENNIKFINFYGTTSFKGVDVKYDIYATINNGYLFQIQYMKHSLNDGVCFNTIQEIVKSAFTIGEVKKMESDVNYVEDLFSNLLILFGPILFLILLTFICYEIFPFVRIVIMKKRYNDDKLKEMLLANSFIVTVIFIVLNVLIMAAGVEDTGDIGSFVSIFPGFVYYWINKSLWKKVLNKGKNKNDGFKCSNCGTFVSNSAKFCTGCGARFEDEPEKKKTRAQFKCDNCGTLVYEDAKECPGCGAVFIDDEPKKEAKFKCDNCGAMVPESATECPNCGEVFEDDIADEYDDVNELYEMAEDYKNAGYKKRAVEAYTRYVEETEKLMKEIEEKCFTFDNSIEFVLAVKKDLTGGKCKDMSYRTSDAYLNLAIMAFDDKDYEMAIKYLNKSLKYNPINIAALFEMAEVHKVKGELDKYLNWTEKCYDRLYYINQLAHYYRNLGYYYIEKKKWKLAQAVYLYSLKYENNPIVEHELDYIAQKTDNIELPKKDELSTILRENDVPTFINKENLKIIKNFHNSLEEKNQLNTNVGKFVTKIIKDNANL